jgi:hypothetical protein
VWVVNGGTSRVELSRARLESIRGSAATR